MGNNRYNKKNKMKIYVNLEFFLNAFNSSIFDLSLIEGMISNFNNFYIEILNTIKFFTYILAQIYMNGK